MHICKRLISWPEPLTSNLLDDFPEYIDIIFNLDEGFLDKWFYLISGKCCSRCCTYSFTTYYRVSNNWYCQLCFGYFRGELYQVSNCIIWNNQIILLIFNMLFICNISNIAGWFIWLEDVVQPKQLVLQKNYVKFLVTFASAHRPSLIYPFSFLVHICLILFGVLWNCLERGHTLAIWCSPSWFSLLDSQVSFVNQFFSIQMPGDALQFGF